MLKAVCELGKYVIENEGLDKEEIFIQKTLERTNKAICVVLKQKNGDLTYYGVHSEGYDSSKAKKYLYRTFDHGQYDVTPTAKSTSADKLKRRWGQWFGTYARDKNQFWGNSLIESLSKEILKNDKKEVREEIIDGIVNKYNELGREEKRREEKRYIHHKDKRRWGREVHW